MLIILILPDFANAGNEDRSITNVEVRGVISSRAVSIWKKPDIKSKRIKTLWRGSKVVVIKKEGDWLKIKVNNVKNGYVLKKYVDFKATFKKETKKGSHLLKKASLEIKSLVDRFNINMNDSMYYEKEGVIPYLEYVYCRKKGKTVSVELNYKGKNVQGHEEEINKDSPFSDMMKSFMEVVFFKMMIVQVDSYKISINGYSFTEDDKKLESYTVLTYDSSSSTFEALKNDNGKIWEYIKSSKPINELFVKYP